MTARPPIAGEPAGCGRAYVTGPLAGSDPSPLQGREPAESMAVGMTSATGSATDRIARVEARERAWLRLERSFHVLVAKFSGLAMASIAALIFLSLDAFFVTFFGGLAFWCVGNAICCAVDADDSREWYQSWVLVRDELQASLPEAA